MNETRENVNCRGRILDVLELINDGALQVVYQHKVPYVDVPAELFNQWDDAYYAEDPEFREQFEPGELAALEAFARLLKQVADETPQQLPTLEEFMKTEHWHRLSAGAAKTLGSMNRGRRNGLAPPPVPLP